MKPIARPILLLIAIAGCGESSSRATRPATKPAEPAPSFARAKPIADPVDTSYLNTMIDRWVISPGKATETWVRVGDVLVGAGLNPSAGRFRFEALLVHVEDGRPVYTAMPNGKRAVDFPLSSRSGGIVFANPSHDHPRTITYARRADLVIITVRGAEGEQRFVAKRSAGSRAPALESADAAFDADNSARAGTAWAERFEPTGVMWPRGGHRVTGARAIAARIDALRSKGMTLRWAPMHSGLSEDGLSGFTAGNYRIVGSSGDVNARGVYLSIWRKQPDGSWKIAFDTGVQTASR